jgi:hypothetical protein
LKNLVFHLDGAGDEANYTVQKTCAALLERRGRELRQFNLFFSSASLWVGGSLRFFPKIALISSDFFSVLIFTYVDKH